MGSLNDLTHDNGKRVIRKVLVTGAGGQLGRSIRKIWESKYSVSSNGEAKSTNVPEFIFATHEQLDITNYNSVFNFVKGNAIDCIVNCAAYTNVDKAQTSQGDAYMVNTIATEILGIISIDFGLLLIHISTDYVFDGEKTLPYDIDDKKNPLSVYGKTKSLGEDVLKTMFEDDTAESRCLVIRTQWLYSEFGKNFLTRMWELISNSYKDNTSDSSCTGRIKVVDDQVGTPTYAVSLAEFIVDYVTYNIYPHKKYDIIHYSDRGVCSWYDFAKFIESVYIQNNYVDKKTSLVPVSTSDYVSQSSKIMAIRPSVTIFSHNSLTKVGYAPDHWMLNASRCIRAMLHSNG